MPAFAQVAQNLFIGASTDTKPAACVIGARCYETNTRKWYITADGGSTWVEMNDLDAVVLGAGTAIIGQVGIDQTTPGTTNNVAVTGMGEVQANPTANTVLGRLKDLLTGIVLAAGSAIIGKVRLVDSGGGEITEAAGHTVKVSGTVTSTVAGTVGIDQVTANANEVVVKSITAGTSTIGRTGHDVTGIGDNRKAVTNAGTAEALAGSTAAKYVIITADAANTGTICVGGATVVAAAATRRGIPLSAGGSCGLNIDNLADVFIDATVSGEGVSFAYLT